MHRRTDFKAVPASTLDLPAGNKTLRHEEIAFEAPLAHGSLSELRQGAQMDEDDSRTTRLVKSAEPI